MKRQRPKNWEKVQGRQEVPGSLRTVGTAVQSGRRRRCLPKS